MKQLLLQYVALIILSLVSINQMYAQRYAQGIVREPNGNPLSGAVIQAKGTLLSTLSDPEGKFKLEIPVGANQVIVSYSGYRSQELDITDDAMDIEMEDGVETDQITVIGSRNIARNRLQTPIPVDVIPIAQIVNDQGQLDLNQILMYTVPAFQANRQTIADGSDHVDPIQLRGLSPDQVLVLVNGKRRHTNSLVHINTTVGRGTSNVDLTAIPIASIERVEILRDGAAAQYGSDAIAGVINIVLKQNTGEFSIASNAGITQKGDGATIEMAANQGFRLGESGFLNIGANFSNRSATNRMDIFNGAIYDENTAKDDSILLAKGLNRSDFNMRVGNAAMRNTGIMANMAMPLGGGLEVYAFGGVTRKDGESAGFFRRPIQTERVVSSLYPNGFLPEIYTTNGDVSFTGGLRGQIRDWNVDFSNSYGRNKFDYRVENSNNASLGEASPESFNCGGHIYSQNITNIDFSRLFAKALKGINVAFGGQYRVENFQILAGEEASWRNYGLRTVYNLDTTANGVVYVNDSSTVDVMGKAGGAQVFPGFRPENTTNRSRTSLGLYADTEFDITKSWMVGAAVRGELFSDTDKSGKDENAAFADAFSSLGWKLTSRYTIANKYTLRGAINTGFHAPSLQQRFFSSTATQFVNGALSEVGYFPNGSRAAEILGIPSLRPERSLDYSLGFTAKVLPNLSFAIDAYTLRIKDRMLLTGQFGGDQDTTIRNLLNAVGASSATFFINGIDTRTSGLDANITYNVPFADNHKLNITFGLNFNQTKAISDPHVPEQLKGREDAFFNRQNQSLLLTGTPSSKASLIINYKYRKWSVMLRNTYFGKITYLDASPDKQLNTFTGQNEVADQVFAPKTVTDLTLTYRFRSGLGITAGANNLLNVYPDKYTHSFNNDGGRFVYGNYMTQFGWNGAYYFARISYILK